MTIPIHVYRSNPSTDGAEYLAKSPGGPPLRYITESQALKKLTQLRAQDQRGVVVRVNSRFLILLSTQQANRAAMEFANLKNSFATPRGFGRVNPRNRHNHPQHNPPVEPRWIP